MRISLQNINRKSPYKVWLIEETMSLRFESDYGIIFSVDFDRDDFIQSGESYMFSLTNISKKSSPRDYKVKDTVLVIVEEFFKENEAALLYLCETGDGKQRMRSRLFEFWFASYLHKDEYLILPFTLEDEEGVENFAALIIRKDNPEFVDVVTEFTNTVNMFRVKP